VNRNADFLQNESIRITNRIDSNRELECSTHQWVFTSWVLFVMPNQQRQSTSPFVVNMTLPTFCCWTPCCGVTAAGHPPPVNQHLLPTRHSAANLPHAAAAAVKWRNGQRGRQTDGLTHRQTLDRFIDPTQHTTWGPHSMWSRVNYYRDWHLCCGNKCLFYACASGKTRDQ